MPIIYSTARPDRLTKIGDERNCFYWQVWETVLISVHDNTTPGPFPVGYAYVSTSYDSGRKSCGSGQTCWIYCYGYSNDIEAAQMFKVSS